MFLFRFIMRVIYDHVYKPNTWYKVDMQQLVFIIFVSFIKMAHWYIFKKRELEDRTDILNKDKIMDLVFN